MYKAPQGLENALVHMKQVSTWNSRFCRLFIPTLAIKKDLYNLFQYILP